MDIAALLSDLFSRVDEHVDEALDGLSIEHLIDEPAPGTNPIGWLIWHLTRVEDHHVSEILGDEQIWITGDWAKYFGVAADPDNTGYGHSDEDVRAIRPASVSGGHRLLPRRCGADSGVHRDPHAQRSRSRRRQAMEPSGDARSALDQRRR